MSVNVELKTAKQNNKTWSLSLKANSRIPIVAERVYATLADAQTWVNDLAADATAYPGAVIAVVNDGKNNGIYYVASIAQEATENTEFVPGVLVSAGAGAGSETVAKFTVTDGKIVEAENIGQILYVTEGTDDYPAGPYIVTAVGAVSKLGTTTATGDLAGDVEALKTKVTTAEGEIDALQTAVGDATSGLVADVAKNASDIATNAGNITKKADIFTVGNGLAYSENKINVVVSTAEGNSLSVDENGLYVSVPEVEVPEYTLVSVDSPADGYASQYQFKKDGEVLNTINIPKDQFLKSATFHATAEEGVSTEAPYLKFIWDLDIDPDQEGVQNVSYVPVKDLVDTYTAGEWIVIENNKIAVDYEYIKSDLAGDLATEFDIAGINSNIESNATTIATLNEIVTKETTGLVDVVSYLEGQNQDFEEAIDDIEYALKNTFKVTDIDDTDSCGVSLKYSFASEEPDSTVIKTYVDIDVLEASLLYGDTELGTLKTKVDNSVLLGSVDQTVKSGINLTLSTDENALGLNVDGAALVEALDLQASDIGIRSMATGGYTLEEQTLSDYLNAQYFKIGAAESNIENHNTRITAVETLIGTPEEDYNKGTLLNRLNSLENLVTGGESGESGDQTLMQKVNANTLAISALQEVVSGDNGLVKAVATLNGDATTTGSVDNKIANALAWVAL